MAVSGVEVQFQRVVGAEGRGLETFMCTLAAGLEAPSPYFQYTKEDGPPEITTRGSRDIIRINLSGENKRWAEDVCYVIVEFCKLHSKAIHHRWDRLTLRDRILPCAFYIMAPKNFATRLFPYLQTIYTVWYNALRRAVPFPDEKESEEDRFRKKFAKTIYNECAFKYSSDAGQLINEFLGGRKAIGFKSWASKYWDHSSPKWSESLFRDHYHPAGCPPTTPCPIWKPPSPSSAPDLQLPGNEGNEPRLDLREKMELLGILGAGSPDVIQEMVHREIFNTVATKSRALLLGRRMIPYFPATCGRTLNDLSRVKTDLKVFNRRAMAVSQDAAVAVIVDVSGSITDRDNLLPSVLGCAYGIAKGLQNTRGVLCKVWTYSTRVNEISIPELRSAKVKGSGGGTNTASALMEAGAWLNSVAKAHPKRICFVLTDGCPNIIEECQSECVKMTKNGVIVLGGAVNYAASSLMASLPTADTVFDIDVPPTYQAYENPFITDTPALEIRKVPLAEAVRRIRYLLNKV